MGYPNHTSRRRLGTATVFAALVAFVPAASVTAAAQDPAPTETAADTTASIPEPSKMAGDGLAIDLALDRLGLGDRWREETALGDRARRLKVKYPGQRSESVVASFVAVVDDLDRTTALRDRISDDLLRNAALLRLATWNEDRLAAVVASGQDRLDAAQGLIQSVAIDMYAGRGGRSDEAAALEHPDLLLTRRSDELIATVLERLLEIRDQLSVELRNAETGLPGATRSRTTAETDRERLMADAAGLPARITELETEATDLLPAAADSFISAEIVGEPGLSLRALEAYFDAESWMDEAQPECGITWQTIGAIGLVESRHGTHLGNRLLADGRTQFQIIGTTLDGGDGEDPADAVANVTDTDGGVYDGDPVHDRAVGPMQFIPETWQQWSVDADGDGRRDPNDMDDAAVATARYLCANGQVRSRAAWNAAILTYNQSLSYVDRIRAAYHRLDDTVRAATDPDTPKAADDSIAGDVNS